MAQLRAMISVGTLGVFGHADDPRPSDRLAAAGVPGQRSLLPADHAGILVATAAVLGLIAQWAA